MGCAQLDGLSRLLLWEIEKTECGCYQSVKNNVQYKCLELEALMNNMIRKYTEPWLENLDGYTYICSSNTMWKFHEENRYRVFLFFVFVFVFLFLFIYLFIICLVSVLVLFCFVSFFFIFVCVFCFVLCCLFLLFCFFVWVFVCLFGCLFVCFIKRVFTC